MYHPLEANHVAYRGIAASFYANKCSCRTTCLIGHQLNALAKPTSRNLLTRLTTFIHPNYCVMSLREVWWLPSYSLLNGCNCPLMHLSKAEKIASPSENELEKHNYTNFISISPIVKRIPNISLNARRAHGLRMKKVRVETVLVPSGMIVHTPSTCSYAALYLASCYTRMHQLGTV